MAQFYSFQEFLKQFPDDDACLEEIKKLRFRNGIYCSQCRKITKHYKLNNRTAYSCELCRHHKYPLAGTIFEKTTTPLRIWFYALYLMTQTRADISVKQLQRELNVTYKTAWRIHIKTIALMRQNKGDLLKDPDESKNKILSWTFFNKLEFKIVQRDGSEGAEEDAI